MIFLFLFSQIALCTKSNDIKLIKEGETPVGERLNISTQEPLELSNQNFAYIDTSTSDGGAIYCSKTNITLQQCTFTSIKGKKGGAIYIYFTKINSTLIPLNCNIKGCTFTSCTGTNGGAVYIESTQPNTFSFNFEECTFTTNEGENGGAIYGYVRDELVIQDCNFTNNKARSSGSSLWLRIGNLNGKDKNDTVILLNNQFTASPDSSSNVYIKNYPVQSGVQAHTHVMIGGCTFGAENPTNPEYKNLILDACPVGFENISFISCNCFKQGESSLTIPSNFKIYNIDFECNSIDQCAQDIVEQPTTPPPPPKPTPDTDGYIPHDRIDDEGKAIDLTKYKFTNTNSESVDGGAVLINSNKVSCKLNNCKFTSCRGKIGGALYVYFATKKSLLELKVTNSEFSNCEATQSGGAIYVKTTQSHVYNIFISSSTFRSNKAATDGGALCLLTRDNLTVSDCTFDNNEAQVGSSVWCQIGWDSNSSTYNTDNTAIFSGNTFIYIPTENSVNVFIQSHKVNITKLPRNAVLEFGQSRFSANKNVDFAYKHLEISNNGDGFQSISFPNCICIDKDQNTVSLPEGTSDESITYNCQSFDSCKPDSDGYKYHSRIGDVTRDGPINLESFKFGDLSSEFDGGAISIHQERTSCFIKKCKFESCKAVNGGAVYIHYAKTEGVYNCTITETQFVDNEASTHGGALYCEITQSNLHSISLSQCKFVSNKANKNGGAIYASTRDSFKVEQCTFENNDAKGVGCTLWCKLGWYNKYGKNTVIMHDNTFSFKPFNPKSINVYIESNYLEDEITPNANLTFGGNVLKATSTEVTGYLHVKISAPSEFEVLNFDRCNCIEQGPETVVLPYSYHAESGFGFNCQKLDSCSPGQQPQDPTPDSDGYTPLNRIDLNIQPTLRLLKSKFINVQSDQSGGAVSLIKASCRITDCIYESCKSTYSNTKNGGGAIYASYSGKDSANYSCVISDTTFNKCESEANGGAIKIYISQAKRHSAIIEGCSFSGNKATYNGGAIHAESRDLLTIRYNYFSNNEAVNGSSLWCLVGWYNGNSEKDNTFQLYSNTFSFKPTQQNSNNVYIKSNNLQEGINPNANIYIGKNQFTSSSMNEGQKHLIIYEDGTFQSISFTDCNCVQGGENTVEIIAASKPDLQKAITFNCDNMNQCSSGSELPPSTDECSYLGSQVFYGQSIELESHCFSNLNSVEGSAVQAINSNIKIEKCKFKDCSSTKDGGAIYANFVKSDCKFKINSCTFENCTCGKQGGAVYFYNNFASESSITSCTFTNNKAGLNGGALYFAPCGNSQLKDCLFVDNTCKTEENAHGSSVFILIKNSNSNVASRKLNLKDEANNNVVIEGNILRSQPTKNGRQMYINLKQTGKLTLGENSFSFDGATEIPEYSRFIQVAADEGTTFSQTGNICLDTSEANTGLVAGIDSNINYNCNAANSNPDDLEDGKPNKDNKNIGLIVGVTIAAVVVVVAIIVIVIFVIKRKNNNKYVSELDHEDNQSGQVTSEAEFASSNV